MRLTLQMKRQTEFALFRLEVCSLPKRFDAGLIVRMAFYNANRNWRTFK